MPSIFTKIIEGKAKAYKIYENNFIIVILAKEQINPGHCLIVPKIETGHFSQLPQSYLYEIHAFSQKLSIALEKVTNCVRIGALFAGWDIDHVHYHLIPMHEYGDLDPSKAKPLPDDEMLELQFKITNELHNILTDKKFISDEIEQIKLLQTHLKTRDDVPNPRPNSFCASSFFARKHVNEDAEIKEKNFCFLM